MSYLVLARKYRPRNFSEMVGQEHVLPGAQHQPAVLDQQREPGTEQGRLYVRIRVAFRVPVVACVRNQPRLVLLSCVPV